jgi:hypothetical protein
MLFFHSSADDVQAQITLTSQQMKIPEKQVTVPIDG